MQGMSLKEVCAASFLQFQIKYQIPSTVSPGTVRLWKPESGRPAGCWKAASGSDTEYGSVPVPGLVQDLH